MSGVPAEAVTAHDFIQVRAALVKVLGGANEALVWCRIDWRSAVTPDGFWAASHELLAGETGLSTDQVRRATKSLLAGEFLEARKDHQHGSYDHTLSYRTVVIGRHADVANSPNRSGEFAESDAANSPDLPIKDVKTGFQMKEEISHEYLASLFPGFGQVKN